MLQNWLKPISGKLLQNKSSQAFLRNLRLYKTTMPDLGLIKIAIIGLESESADVIRKQLYRLSYPFKGLKIADLGNIRKCEPAL